MKFSFVISSYDRIKDLLSCISSIEDAYETGRDIDIEIKVIFKGRGTNSLEARYPQLIKVFAFEGIGLSSARNVGIKESAADFIILIDDDAMVKNDFLVKLSDYTQKYDSKAFCGRILDTKSNEPFAVCYKSSDVKCLKWSDYQYFRGSNIIIQRQLVQKIGFFDENFGSGAKYFTAEDSDIFFRLKQSRENVLYLPEAVIYHPIMEEPIPLRVYNYSYGTGAMLAKQILNDKLRFYVYLKIMVTILLKNLVRTVQGKLFPEAMADRTRKYKYSSALRGMIKGIVDYIKFR